MLVYVHGFCLSLPFIFLIRKIVSEGAFSRLTPISDFTYSSRYRVSVSYCIYIRVKSEGILTSTVFTSISTLTTVFNLVYQRGTVNVPTVVVLHFQEVLTSMERDTETETCSSVINKKNKKRDIEALQEGSIENKDDSKNYDDESVIEVEIDKEEIKKLPANINLQFKSFCSSDDISWSIDAGNCLTVDDFDVSLNSKVVENDHKNDPTTLEIKKKIIMPAEKLDYDFCDKGNEEELEITEKSNLQTSKKQKRPQDEDVHSSKISNIDDINNDQISNKTNLTSNNSSKLHESTHLTADIYGPSCSKNYTSLPSPMNIEEESKYLLDFYKECFLKDSIVPMQVPEDVKIENFEECDYVESVRRSMGLENDDELLDVPESDDFVDDPDVINPEVMYNIDLNEHYKQMEILTQEISQSPNDLTLLNKCLELPPIPQVQHEPKTFTTEQRLMFMNGISEWDYKIDRNDWTKIMVKRACIFIAHAGFSIANEESLYVLADVAIDYIKKFAVILKNNFDIQSNSSHSSSIDPISLSLEQIGVSGGIKAVVDHYKHDIFDRRNKQIKKCQYLQKVINQYVERMQYNNLQDNENELIQEMDMNSESQSLMDEIQKESQQLRIESIANSELLLTDPVCIDNTDFEPKMDINSRSVKSIKTDAMEVRNRQLNDPTTVGTKEMHIDLLKLVTPDNDERPVSECFEKVDKEKFLKEWVPSSDLESYSERKKKGNLLDLAAVEKMLAHLYPPIVKETDPIVNKNAQEIIRIKKEFEDEFQKFKNSRKSKKSLKNVLKNAGSSQTDKNVAHDNSTPIKSVFASENLVKDEANVMDTNNTIQNITVIDDNLDDGDNDLVSMQPKSLNDP